MHVITEINSDELMPGWILFISIIVEPQENLFGCLPLIYRHLPNIQS